MKKNIILRATTPEEGKMFDVNPATIDGRLFTQERKDEKQEMVRKLILEALKEADVNHIPKFRTLMPRKYWSSYMTVRELTNLANSVGHMATWVEQALEWGQRLTKGESWEELCNQPDKADCYRMIIWKNGYPRLIGGSSKDGSTCSATDIDKQNYLSWYHVYNTVPLVVSYVE